MKIIAFAEQREGKLKKSAFEVLTAGNILAQQLGAEPISLIVGHNLEAIANSLGEYGTHRILIAHHEKLNRYSITAYAKVVAEIARKEQANIFPVPKHGNESLCPDRTRYAYWIISQKRYSDC